ncbi:coiled-coil alpha-helical rod protein 1-like [Watersipora subatra]|uniref:coiled-coil alpha-helical rod protein 1-like n=1 Tax=Watersipora subatra TaxID=2589382 RepID=UPI00355C181A
MNSGDSHQQSGSVLLPPAAFASEDTDGQLLSPSKFVSAEPRRNVQIVTPSTSSEEISPRVSPKKTGRVSHRSTGNICSGPVEIQEIERLRKDNYRLMEENLKKTFESCAKAAALCPKPLQVIDTNTQKHVDSLISKQADEINDLRNQIMRIQSECNKTLAEAQQENADQADKHERDLSILRAQHELQRKEIHREFSLKESDFEEKRTNLERQQDVLQRSLLAAQAEAGKCREELETLSQDTASLNSQLMSVQGMCEEKEIVIQQLRTQLRTYQELDGEKERWPEEKRQLERKLSSITADCDRLENENEILLVRVSSINSILTAQQDSLRTGGPKDRDEDRLHTLLDKWRYKVYQLLVQQKSRELVERKEGDEWRRHQVMMEGQMQSLQSKIRELSASVEDKQGQITLLTRQKQKLESSNKNLQLTLVESKAREKWKDEMCEKAMLAVQELYSLYESQVGMLSSMEGRVKQQDSRVIGVCKLFKRCSGAVQSKLEGLDARLSEKLRECENLDGKLSESVGECQGLTQKLANSELVKRDIQQKFEELQRSYLDRVQFARDKEEQVASLTNDINKFTNHIDLERKGVELEIHGQYKDRIAQYELQILNLKRDLAKTVLALRQSERRTEGHHTSHTQEIAAVRSQSRARTESLEADLASVQVERNILQSNLAAMGAKVRSPPRRIPSSKIPPQSPSKNAAVEQGLSAEAPNQTYTSSLLGSVTQLAASVLNSESDGDDSIEGSSTTTSTSAVM